MVFEDFGGRILTLLDNWTFRLIFIVVILAITSAVAKVFNLLVKKYFHHSARHLNIDQTRFSILSKLITASIYIIGIAIAGSTIPGLKTVSLSLLTGAGVLAAIVGFASQQAMSNIINGIFIAMFKPFRVGDRVQVMDTLGDIEDITLRHTIIKNFENKRIIIPNSIIGNESITNFSIADPKIVNRIDFGISYDSDVELASQIIKDEIVKHPHWIDTRTQDEKNSKKRAVNVIVRGYSNSSVLLRGYAWAPDPTTAFYMKSDLYKSIKKRFDREGVEMPFPYRTIVYKKDMKKTAHVKHSAKKRNSVKTYRKGKRK